MDLLTLLRVLLRRWYIVLPAMILTAIATVQTYSAIAPRYTSSGSMVLLNPSAAVDEKTGRANPYVGNLGVATSVVTTIITSPANARRLEAEGLMGEFTVAPDPASGIIIVTVEADAAEAASAGAVIVMDAFSDLLAERQKELGVPSSILVTTQVVTPASDPSTLNGSKIRAALALLAVGVAFTLVLTFAIEGVARRRAKASRVAAPAPVRRDHSAECPFCDAVLPGSELASHLGDVHGLGADGGGSSVYAFAKKRLSRRNDDTSDVHPGRSSPSA